jgi:hypothetical protein
MPAVAYRYVVYPGFGAPHARRPQRAAGLSGGFDATTLAARNSNPTYAAEIAVTVSVDEMPGTLRDALGKPYDFAFAHVSGAASAPQTAFTNTAAFQYVVGSETQVLFVYVPSGAVDAGVSIDAFDITRGTLVDDDFVSVNVVRAGAFSSDPALTTSGNLDGWLPSPPANTIYGLTASSHITDTNADFQGWHFAVSQTPPASPGPGFVIDPDQRTSLLAFYKDSPQEHPGVRGPGSLQKEVILLEPGGGSETFPGDAPGAPIVFSNENSNENTPPERPR